ncbi:hypothetical protein [Streptomyces sp. HUAS TT20]|uniref:hypothetical protein n=1 Tax=Streptomyces sp. HUAS TT20 TaxID=3447509 RepID=UPI0021DA7EE9|nr:hypothetical protein [Streptomyces sp. HUAS 15-9]UXY28203.1 hypothetical protein N8I87_17565 [Streptomyces sp. HUAS 15-9]
MSDETKTTEADAATTEDAEITTLNSHATIAPLNLTTPAAPDEDATAKPDNSHATGETA